jgi:uncharacterized protein YbjQ (UPF0145 family)
MTTTSMQCSNCGQSFKEGLIRSNRPLSTAKVAVINEYSSTRLDAACGACGSSAYDKAHESLNGEINNLDPAIIRDSALIPILSIHSPTAWNYHAVGIVTAQSVTGTGIFSDVTASVTDLFGAQSGTYIGKIANGEMMCCTMLRMKALALNCNAILAADVDYAEVGGARAMLMVCMTGTAVQLKNIEVFGSHMEKALNHLHASYERARSLKKLRADLEYVS